MVGSGAGEAGPHGEDVARAAAAQEQVRAHVWGGLGCQVKGFRDLRRQRLEAQSHKLEKFSVIPSGSFDTVSTHSLSLGDGPPRGGGRGAGAFWSMM